MLIKFDLLSILASLFGLYVVIRILPKITKHKDDIYKPAVFGTNLSAIVIGILFVLPGIRLINFGDSIYTASIIVTYLLISILGLIFILSAVFNVMSLVFGGKWKYYSPVDNNQNDNKMSKLALFDFLFHVVLISVGIWLIIYGAKPVYQCYLLQCQATR